MPDINFVGAGPVGLFTAIQAKLYNPDLNILMLEKYTEYQRKIKNNRLVDEDETENSTAPSSKCVII